MAAASSRGIAFCLYGGDVFARIGRHSLLGIQEQTGMLLARAENSTCEGCCVEIAIWNDECRQWQRFAYLKCLGGEHYEFPDEDALQTATRIANEINNAGQISSERAALIARLPTYDGPKDFWRV